MKPVAEAAPQRRIGLNAKLSALLVGAVLFVALALGVYFDSVIRGHFRAQAQQQIEHAFNRLAFNLVTIENQLRDGVSFVQTDERFMASVDLVNKYQDKQAYNVFLIDEEKKLIARELLARVRLGFNSDAAIFDENNELVAYAEKAGASFHQGIISFAGGEMRALELEEKGMDYVPASLPGGSINIEHKDYYAPGQPLSNSVVTYHRVGDALVIKSHLHLYLSDKKRVIGHIEMTRVLDAAYFETLSKDFGISIRAAFDSPHADQAQVLGADLRVPALKLVPGEQMFAGILKKATANGPIFFIASHDINEQNGLLWRSRLQLGLLLLGVVGLVLGLAWLFSRHVLARPLRALQSQLDKIRHQDYSIFEPMRTQDELQDISVTINELAKAVRVREQELDAHRQHLESVVDERTAALKEALLNAEAASVAKSAFLSNMSHEIRTPLNAITGMAYLIQKSGLSPVQSERMRKLLDAGQHLLSVINDVLDFSKIEAGELHLDEYDFRLTHVFANVQDMIAPRATEKGLEVRIDIDPALPVQLRGDRLRIGQILLNFASNAVKFTEKGRIDLRARQVEVRPDGTLIRFEVCDTGIGITPEQQSRLFQAFSQADVSTTRKYGGTGLGLVISQRLAGLMHGRIGVDSEAGKGSTFWFEVCLASATGDACPAEGQPVLGAAVIRGLGGQHVLLVEDNLINQEVALDLLADAGIRADLAENGQVAVAMAGKTPYAAILMDVQMPVMDGLAASREIRKLPEYSNTPIIAMTANAFNEDREACLAAGMNDHIGKPIHPDTLLATLKKWLPPDGLHQVMSLPPHDQAAVVLEHDLGRFRSIAGLDVDQGLELLRGRGSAYLHLLELFVSAHSSDMRTLGEALAANDWVVATRIVHSLKGVAGNLGAVEVRERAFALEKVLRANAVENVAAAYKALVQAQESLLSQLQQAFRLS